MVRENEWMTQSPGNAAAHVLTALLGPQRGAYTGPYPTEAEAQSALQLGASISLDDLLSDEIDVAGQRLRLDTGVGQGLLQGMPLGFAIGDKAATEAALKESGPVRAAIWQERCVLLRIPCGEAGSARIAVIDRVAGRPFAYYAEGNYSHHFPPVCWRKR